MAEPAAEPTQAFPDYEPTIPVFLRRCAERFGERPLILLGDRRIRYAEAERESARLARGLLATGVGKGTRVGLLAPNGPDWVIGWLAAARIGAVLVPINTFVKPRELGWLLRHADVHTLLCVPRLQRNDYPERLEACAPSLREQKAGPGRGWLVAPELPQLRQVFLFGEATRPWAQSCGDLAAAADGEPRFDAALLRAVEDDVAPADPMVIIYSSGSVTEPKGAIHTHGAAVRHSANLNQYRDVTPDDRIWSVMPFFWVGGLVVTLMQAMHEGCFLLCEEVFEAGPTLEMLERERATVVGGWPQYVQAMQAHPSYASRDLSSVRSGNLYDLLPEELRPADPQLRSNSLGMTETCGPHTYDRMDVDLPERLRGSFGRAVPGMEHKIVDPRTGETLPPGQHGEICVRGYSLMLGLHKQERDAVFDADGYYRTGDGGHFDEEGHLFFQARLGEMIKTGGANVTPREVELLMDALPEVQSAFVVGVPHPTRGQNVAAAVVLHPGSQVTEEELRERLRRELSAYKVPRHVFFYRRDELPFTDSGKVEKKKLVTMLTTRLAP